MTINCDLHIHSDLSPCAEPEMTPGNIVGMAKLNGLQVIAVTDHQSCGNCGPVMKISEMLEGPLVIPGMEVESQEEIHLVCLFPDLETVKRFEAIVREALPNMPNRPDIFGNQHLYDEDDEIIGEEDRLLLLACQLSCDEIARTALEMGGVCLPAHIDRDANSMLATLGMIPDDFPARWLELSTRADERKLLEIHPELINYRMLKSSDAHRLADILEPGWPINIPHFTNDDEGRRKVIQALRP